MTTEPTTGTTTPPATAPGGSLVEKLKGKTKEAVGTVIGDDQLVAEGHLHEAKAEAADDAAKISMTAAQKEAEAELTAREKQAAVDAERVAAEADAAASERVIAAEAERRDAQVEREAATAKKNAEATRRQRVAQTDKAEFDAARRYSAEIGEAAEIEAKARRVRLSARLPKLTPQTEGVVAAVRGLPGRALSTYLGALRLPLTAYERRTGSEGSAASIAFERFDATLRELLGSVVHDPALLAEARRENVEVGRLGEAAELEEAAAAKRARADERLAAAKQATEEAKRSAASAAQDQEARAADRESSAKRAAREQAAKAKSSARSRAADREAAVEAKERAGTAAALRKEQEALAAERAALSRGDDVIALDNAVEASKNVRAHR